jgi:hypothetical protein
MSRPLSERVKDWRWWLDQLLHVAIGGVAAAAVAVPIAAVGAVCAALWLGTVREFDQRPVASWGDLAADMAFTALGGLAVGLIIWGVA